MGLAVINSLKMRFKMSAGGKISQVMTGIIRPKSSASLSVPRFILIKWKIKKEIKINNQVKKNLIQTLPLEESAYPLHSSEHRFRICSRFI